MLPVGIQHFQQMIWRGADYKRRHNGDGHFEGLDLGARKVHLPLGRVGQVGTRRRPVTARYKYAHRRRLVAADRDDQLVRRQR